MLEALASAVRANGKADEADAIATRRALPRPAPSNSGCDCDAGTNADASAPFASACTGPGWGARETATGH